MYAVDAVTRDYGPRKKITEQIPETASLTQMYEQDSAFLCGLLKMTKPRKILEVGVADGGTSAVIQSCMQEIGGPYSLYGVDIRKTGFSGDGRETGHLGKEAAKLFGFAGYHVYSERYLPQVIGEIGDGIDFLILDTMHVLPGEILDFLAAFPFLTDDATVVLHDLRQNHKEMPAPERIATNVLFNSVAADKYINADAARTPDYPNTGAFRLQADTGKYITNVIGGLTQNWAYLPEEKVLGLYNDLIRKYYSKEACWLFERAVEMNLLSARKQDELREPVPLRQKLLRILRGKNG